MYSFLFLVLWPRAQVRICAVRYDIGLELLFFFFFLFSFSFFLIPPLQYMMARNLRGFWGLFNGFSNSFAFSDFGLVHVWCSTLHCTYIVVHGRQLLCYQ
jgi:hypothetical protein